MDLNVINAGVLNQLKRIRQGSLRDLKPYWQSTKQFGCLSQWKGVKRGHHSQEARAKTAKDNFVPSRLRGPEENP